MPVPLAADLVGSVANFVVAAPRQTNKGGVAAYINTAEGGIDSVTFQTTATNSPHRCRTPFGVSKPHATSNDPTRVNMEVSVTDPDLLAFLSAFDSRMVDLAVVNTQKWFGRVLPRERILEMYRPLVPPPEYPKDAAKNPIPGSTPYPSRFRTKVNTTGANASEFFLVSETIDPATGQPQLIANPSQYDAFSSVPKYSEVVVSCAVSGLWFMKAEWAVNVEAVRTLVFPAHARADTTFNMGSDVTFIHPFAANPSPQGQQQAPPRFEEQAPPRFEEQAPPLKPEVQIHFSGFGPVE